MQYFSQSVLLEIFRWGVLLFLLLVKSKVPCLRRESYNADKKSSSVSNIFQTFHMVIWKSLTKIGVFVPKLKPTYCWFLEKKKWFCTVLNRQTNQNSDRQLIQHISRSIGILTDQNVFLWSVGCGWLCGVEKSKLKLELRLSLAIKATTKQQMQHNKNTHNISPTHT